MTHIKEKIFKEVVLEYISSDKTLNRILEDKKVKIYDFWKWLLEW